MRNLFKREQGAREEVKDNSMAKKGTIEQRNQFDEEFNRWVVEMEEQIESTRRSEQLTQEDFAIRINAQD